MPARKRTAAKALKAAKPTAVVASNAKRRLNISVRGDLLQFAKASGLNLSQVMEDSLAERLRKVEGERWLKENAEAIAYHNTRIAKEGMWNRDLIRF